MFSSLSSHSILVKGFLKEPKRASMALKYISISNDSFSTYFVSLELKHSI
jgi:hypothetical protein